MLVPTDKSADYGKRNGDAGIAGCLYPRVSVSRERERRKVRYALDDFEFPPTQQPHADCRTVWR